MSVQRVSVIRINPNRMEPYSSTKPSHTSKIRSVTLLELQKESCQDKTYNNANTIISPKTQIFLSQINELGFGRIFDDKEHSQNESAAVRKKNLKKKGPIPKLFDNERCKVCGDKASGFHYQVVSCEGCKGFFRRSILASKIYVCKNKARDCMDDPYMRRRCQYCRLSACYDSGMKPEFVQKIRNETSGKTSKTISELNRMNQNLTFQQVLSPLQEDLVQDVTNFWSCFCSGPAKMITKLSENVEPSSRNKQHEYERGLKVRLEELSSMSMLPPWSQEPNSHGLKVRFLHMVSLAKVHHNSLDIMCQIISQFKRLEKTTKRILIDNSSLEMVIMRAAYLQQTNGHMTALLSNEQYSIQDLRASGMNDKTVQSVIDTINIIQNHNLDEFDYAILASIILMSPDRGQFIDLAERRALGNIQECLAAILEIKLQKEGKHSKHFSACILLVTRIRSFSENLQKKWKFITSAN